MASGSRVTGDEDQNVPTSRMGGPARLGSPDPRGREVMDRRAGFCCHVGAVAYPNACPWHPTDSGGMTDPPPSHDPRVKHGDGPHPNITAVTELAESVHARLDALGVPRFFPAPESSPPGRHGGELTLLGRMDAWLNQMDAENAENWRKWNARPDTQRARP